MATTTVVFISQAAEDNARCEPLLAALDAWGLAYQFRARTADDAGTPSLIFARQQALRECRVFLRVCTPAAGASAGRRGSS